MVKLGTCLFLSLLILSLLITSCAEPKLSEVEYNPLPKWQAGNLDIHFVNTGRGDAAFMIFPDGTTLLFDAGSVDLTIEERYPPMKLALPMPNSSRRPGEWVVNYIDQVIPSGRTDLDYAMLSHFHADHYGIVVDGLPKSSKGDWFLTGITDVAERIQIKSLIDRGYPDYNFPVDLSRSLDDSFRNYLSFVEHEVTTGKMTAEILQAGRRDQIVLKNDPDAYPNFHVQNIAVNGDIWTGVGTGFESLATKAEFVNSEGGFNGNPLSLAIKISYGDFDFFTGGDITGAQELGEPLWFDVETPIAKSIGETDVFALNHHGNRDATNANFLSGLKPRVLIQQSWISDHPGGEVVHRMASQYLWEGERDIFSTNLNEETKSAIGPWLTNAYKSTQGHIVIRVHPDGHEYDVYILDDTRAELNVREKFGPYKSR